MNVVVFGGSFNPPHIAHVLGVAWVLATSDIDLVLVVPAFRHPFAKSLAPYADRVKMCELAMAWLPRVEVSRLEEELGGESRTLRTIEHLAKTHPDYKLRLLIGSDVLLESPKWFRFDAIAELAPPLVLGRAGFDATPQAPPTLLPGVSSTEVRALMAEGRWDELEPLVPRAVVAYAKERGLYR